MSKSTLFICIFGTYILPCWICGPDIALQTAVSRNFGGLPSAYQEMIESIFFKDHGLPSPRIPSIELVHQNLQDAAAHQEARHLLVAASGDSAVDIFSYVIKKHDQQVTVIRGSKFPDDMSGDYSYRVLSRVILCMEQGGVLVLHDLDHMYGALYDVLNQVGFPIWMHTLSQTVR